MGLLQILQEFALQEGYTFTKGTMARRSLKRVEKYDVSVSKSTKPEDLSESQSPNPIKYTFKSSVDNL